MSVDGEIEEAVHELADTGLNSHDVHSNRWTVQVVEGKGERMGFTGESSRLQGVSDRTIRSSEQRSGKRIARMRRKRSRRPYVSPFRARLSPQSDKWIRTTMFIVVSLPPSDQNVRLDDRSVRVVRQEDSDTERLLRQRNEIHADCQRLRPKNASQ